MKSATKKLSAEITESLLGALGSVSEESKKIKKSVEKAAKKLAKKVARFNKNEEKKRAKESKQAEKKAQKADKPKAGKRLEKKIKTAKNNGEIIPPLTAIPMPSTPEEAPSTLASPIPAKPAPKRAVAKTAEKIISNEGSESTGVSTES